MEPVDLPAPTVTSFRGVLEMPTSQIQTQNKAVTAQGAVTAASPVFSVERRLSLSYAAPYDDGPISSEYKELHGMVPARSPIETVVHSTLAGPAN